MEETAPLKKERNWFLQLLDSAVVKWGISWIGLRRIGRSRTVRSAYAWLIIVPLAARGLSEAPDVVNFVFGEDLIPITLTLPFSWQAFFLAALAFSIGAFLFSWKCPELIRDFDDLSDFIKKSRSGSFLVRQAALADEAFCPLGENAKRFEQFVTRHLSDTSVGEIDVKKAYLDAIQRLKASEADDDNALSLYTWTKIDVITFCSVHEGNFPDAFESVRLSLQYCNPGFLLLSQTAFFIGFILLLILLWQNAVFVLTFAT